MAESFGDNYSDLSDSGGFQFEFRCEGCGDIWRTQYVKYAAGTAKEFLDAAGSMFGGILGKAGEVVDRVSESGYHQARDKAFAAAAAEAKSHFAFCPGCHDYFCPKCMNAAAGKCTSCAESGESGASDKKTAKKTGAPKVRCSACGKSVASSKFCSECGKELLSHSSACAACGAKLEPTDKFCPDCGAKAER